MPKITRPKTRLKPFFWNKLTGPVTSSTIWNEISPDFSPDLSDLESTFSIDDATSKSSQLSVSSPKKQAVTTLLDITRANNVDIRRAILELDDNLLSVDDLKAIGKQLPTSEEITRIKDFEDIGKLAKADQYFSEIMVIPRLSHRLECMLFRRKLELEIEEIRPELDITRNASRELRSSTRFNRVLQTILAVGNALNGSSFRGNARGFQLDALAKLKETKTAKGGSTCPTLMHYIAKVLLKNNADLINFIEEMPHLEAAARVSVQTVTASIQSFVVGMDQVKEEIKQTQTSKSRWSNDRFVAVMQPFAIQMSTNVDAMKKMSTSLETELRSLFVYFGEPPDPPEAPKPEDFFGMVLLFSSSLQKAALEVHDAEAKLIPTTPKVVVEETPDAESSGSTLKATSDSLGQKHTLKPPPDSQGRAGGRTLGRGGFDEAIRSMRDGKRRARPGRPLSKIFVDGARDSRLYDRE
ncbi:hypothetical protein NLI96_g12545 [Meripilus lineatus]|uniref:FH2 domain-containing protein n=1 Tax=Meripilus lineatus TaxID=2056292 RepID=A0AAD5Y9S9_9APHY|nr:hypothetical protein NLI96_g12545 [Physisporinus lineatus]